MSRAGGSAAGKRGHAAAMPQGGSDKSAKRANTNNTDAPRSYMPDAPPSTAGMESVWSSMYTPLPPALQHTADHTAAASSSDASASAAVAAAGGGYVPALLCHLLPSPASFESNFATKVRDKHLMLDNSGAGQTGGAPLADSKINSKRRKKRAVNMMSSNQRKEKGMQRIPKDNIKYDMFLPLHDLWLTYMQDILDPANSRGLSVGERVLKADFHGAILTVVRCRSPTHVGQRGILIQETQETFVIVTNKHAVKVLPKRHTIFSFSVAPASPAVAFSAAATTPPPPPQVFELYGDHMCFRSYERAARKFKAKATIML